MTNKKDRKSFPLVEKEVMISSNINKDFPQQFIISQHVNHNWEAKLNLTVQTICKNVNAVYLNKILNELDNFPIFFAENVLENLNTIFSECQK